MIAQKRMVRVTLDIECYDDLDVENIDWKDLLELEGDEEVHSSVKEFDPFYIMWQYSNWHKTPRHLQEFGILYLSTEEFAPMLDTDLLMRYEIEGLDTDDEVIELFQQIYDTKAYNWLQGHYGRMLSQLMEEGYINLWRLRNWHKPPRHPD